MMNEVAVEQEKGRKENKRKSKRERKIFKKSVCESVSKHLINHKKHSLLTDYGGKYRKWNPEQVTQDIN
jgi:hypothetical protein